MKKQSKIRNPFAGAADEKMVRRKLSENSRPVSQEEFLKRMKEARQHKDNDK